MKTKSPAEMRFSARLLRNMSKDGDDPWVKMVLHKVADEFDQEAASLEAAIPAESEIHGPPINLETTCPQCGAKLRIKGVGNEMRADDRVFCSVHGDVGSLDEALRIAVEKAHNDLVEHAGASASFGESVH